MRNYQHILITGGAGFVGSNLAISLAGSTNAKITCLDNLHRRGSELSLPRLSSTGVEFVHGDIRIPADIKGVEPFDLLIECSAEPSVHAGYNSAPDYVIDTNLQGTVNCLEAARKHGADVVYLSSSRIYPIKPLRSLPLERGKDRFYIPADNSGTGWSADGITTDFPLQGARSIYGATKLCSELIIEEYRSMYDLRCIVNRCGVLAGPWQMGMVDQGFVSLWASRHYYKNSNLSYIGFGGEGMQVRDVLHIEDLHDLIVKQTSKFDELEIHTFNVGGGPELSISLRQLTDLCQKKSGNELEIASVADTRDADIAWYVTDIEEVSHIIGWHPARTIDTILEDTFSWIEDNNNQLEQILNK